MAQTQINATLCLCTLLQSTTPRRTALVSSWLLSRCLESESPSSFCFVRDQQVTVCCLSSWGTMLCKETSCSWMLWNKTKRNKNKKQQRTNKQTNKQNIRCGSLEYTQKHVRRSSIATYSFNCVLQQNLNESGQTLTMSEWHTRHQSEDWSVFKNNT